MDAGISENFPWIASMNVFSEKSGEHCSRAHVAGSMVMDDRQVTRQGRSSAACSPKAQARARNIDKNINPILGSNIRTPKKWVLYLIVTRTGPILGPRSDPKTGSIVSQFYGIGARVLGRHAAHEHFTPLASNTSRTSLSCYLSLIHHHLSCFQHILATCAREQYWGRDVGRDHGPCYGQDHCFGYIPPHQQVKPKDPEKHLIW